MKFLGLKMKKNTFIMTIPSTNQQIGSKLSLECAMIGGLQISLNLEGRPSN